MNILWVLKEIKEKMGEELDVRDITLKNPVIKIIGVEDDVSGNEDLLINNLKKHNEL